jgi:hypothetical protein
MRIGELLILGDTRQTSDYEIEPGGTPVRLLSERATRRGVGPRPKLAWAIAFKSRQETAEFVRREESDGLRFDGKLHLAGFV